MKKKKLKKLLLEKTIEGELPVFFTKPIFLNEEDDSFIMNQKFLSVKDYQTNKYNIPDIKIIRPICKTFKL